MLAVNRAGRGSPGHPSDPVVAMYKNITPSVKVILGLGTDTTVSYINSSPLENSLLVKKTDVGAVQHSTYKIGNRYLVHGTRAVTGLNRLFRTVHTLLAVALVNRDTP